MSTRRAVAVVTISSMLGSACSWALVAGPAPAPSVAAPAAVGPPSLTAPTPGPAPAGCTRSKLLPTIDAVVGWTYSGTGALLGLGGLAILARAENSDDDDVMGAGLLAAGTIALLFGLPWLASSRAGHADVDACRAAYLRSYGRWDF